MMNIWNRRVFFTVLFIVLPFIQAKIDGQNLRKEVPPFRERLFFAGNMGLQFGTYTNIQMAPSVGLWVLPRLAIAAGPTYQFYKDPYGKTDIYGPRVYSQFLFIRDINNIVPIGVGIGIYTHIEYEGLSLKKDFWQAYNETGRFFVHSALAGFGINQQIGQRSSMTFTLLWELTDSGYEIYGNPEIRIGFTF
jgi:hypothetical protein